MSGFPSNSGSSTVSMNPRLSYVMSRVSPVPFIISVTRPVGSYSMYRSSVSSPR